MREIKFRAVLIKKFNAKKPGKFVYFTLEELDHFYEVRLPIDWKTVQQFTGLTDRHGKEIYEGDILAIPDTEHESVTDEGQGPDYDVNSIGIVKWIKNGWGLSFLDDCHGDYLEGEMSFDEVINNVGDEDWEIIGNIYENPELLKDK